MRAASPVASTATVRLELRRRNTELTAALSELAEWVVDQTARAVGELFPVTMNPRNEKENMKKFDFLTDFLHQITCYQIDFGYDMDEFARLVGELTE